jgi:hypothetical protein
MSAILSSIRARQKKRIEVARFFGLSEDVVNDATTILETDDSYQTLCPPSERLYSG